MNWIKFFRNEQGLTQEEFSKKTKIPLSTLKRIENSDSVSDSYLTQIAKAFDVNLCQVSEKACIEDARKTAKLVYSSLPPDFSKDTLMYRKNAIIGACSRGDANTVIENILLCTGLITSTYSEFIFTVIADMKYNLDHTKAVVYAFVNALN